MAATLSLWCLLKGKYVYQAKKRQVPFTLTTYQFTAIASKSCYLCGALPSQVFKKLTRHKGHILYNGIDRVDNTKGYTLENSKPCCAFCNTMKSDHELGFVFSKLRSIVKNWGLV